MSKLFDTFKIKMKYEKINSDLFIYNRSLLFKNLESNSLSVFNSNDIMPTNSDGNMPFVQNSDLFWLTGIDQEESILLLYKGKSNNDTKELLFIKKNQ